MKSAWLFPGQASQNIGMGKDIFDHTDLGKHYFESANDIMECDIQSIIFQNSITIHKQSFAALILLLACQKIGCT